MVEQDAAPALRASQACTRAAPGPRLAANKGRPPGAGWRTAVHTGTADEKHGPLPKGERPQISPDGASLSGWRAKRRPRVLERDTGTQDKWMVASPGAPPPPYFEGREKRDGRQAYPGPRQRIRVISYVFLREPAGRRALLFDK